MDLAIRIAALRQCTAFGNTAACADFPCVVHAWMEPYKIANKIASQTAKGELL